VATQEALYLVAYLQSLKQAPLPDGRPIPQFLTVPGGGAKAAPDAPPSKGPDGTQLYVTYCQACHQPNGEGIKGAFPSLKGSKVVLDDNPELQATIIMSGYTGRLSEGYGPMPPVGANNNLTPEEVTAIINHERSSWGNNGKKAEVAAVEKFIQELKDKQK
jgi:cytochrome c oxidase cbb3-type subunit 2